MPETRRAFPIAAALLAVAGFAAQANDFSGLKPPVKPGSQLAPATPPPQPPPTPNKPTPGKSTSLTSQPTKGPAGPAPQSTARFQTIQAGNRLVDLRTASNSEVLTAPNGRTITVERIKQLQGRIDAARPVLVAKPNQSLASLGTAPAGTQVLLRGQMVRSEVLATVSVLRAKLSAPRTVKPLPSAKLHANAKPDGVVGQNGLTMAEALKRPGNQVIQVGTLKYSADQLRQVDAIVKASPKDPRGLAERVGGRTASAAPPAPIKTGPRFTVTKATPFATMLSKPDDTVLRSPNGKEITVGQLKQYMAKEKLSAADLAKRFQGGKK